MPKSLEQFHFNPLKFGQIIKTTAKERGVSQTAMGAKTGLSFDTIGNIYGGKVQKIPFEYVFKMCVVLGVSVEVIMLLMLKDEDVDFFDDVLLYDTQQDTTVPAPEAVPSMVPGPVPDVVANAAIAATTSDPTPTDPPAGYYTIEDINRAVDQATARYEAIIAHMTESRQHLIQQHERHITDIKDQQAAERGTAERYQRLLHRLIDNLTAHQRDA